MGCFKNYVVLQYGLKRSKFTHNRESTPGKKLLQSENPSFGISALVEEHKRYNKFVFFRNSTYT